MVIFDNGSARASPAAPANKLITKCTCPTGGWLKLNTMPDLHVAPPTQCTELEVAQMDVMKCLHRFEIH